MIRFSADLLHYYPYIQAYRAELDQHIVWSRNFSVDGIKPYDGHTLDCDCRRSIKKGF